MDFVDRGLKNIIVFANQKGIEEMKAFYRVYDEQVNVKQIVNIVYNKSNFASLISQDSAFWKFTDLFCNLTYDQIKVLEFNSKVMDYINL